MSSIANAIVMAATAAGVPSQLALEVGIKESGLNQSAVSPAGAIGVMQLMPATAASLGVNPYDVNQNIEGGVAYLARLLNQFGDPAMALGAYNWGPSAVASAVAAWGANWLAHAPAETQNYVNSILGAIGSQYTITPSLPLVADTSSPVAAVAVPTTSIETILMWIGIGAAVVLGFSLVESTWER